MASNEENASKQYLQSLYFLLSDGYKCETLDPSIRAEIFHSVLNQYDVSKLLTSVKSTSDEVLFREHLLQYGNIIDYDKGLNNFAEAILSLSSHKRNECVHWETSLESSTDEEIAEFFPAATEIQDVYTEPSDDDVKHFLNASNDSSVIKFNKVPVTVKECEGSMFDSCSKPSILQDTQPSSVAINLNCNFKSLSKATSVIHEKHSSRAIPPFPKQNIYFDAMDSVEANLEKESLEGPRPYSYCIEKESNDLQKFPFKLCKEQTWNVQNHSQNITSTENPRTSSRRQLPRHKQCIEDMNIYKDNENGRFSSAFSTAREQLIIDQQKKFGCSSSGGGGTVLSAEYGTFRKSLGTRRGLNAKFSPPVINKNSDSSDGGLLMSRKEMCKNEILDERLKNIDSRMVEMMQNEIMDHGPPITWDDIAGLEFAKKTIQEIVVWPLLRPDIFTGLRGPPKGILLFGPPGTGKTLIGKCIASQSKSTFFCISASSLTSKWVGEGEKMVRALFAVARCYQPAVIFIDEIDSLLSQRSETEHESTRRIKTEFLVQLDGAATACDERLLIVGATNRPQELDEAARRRLVKRLYIPLPDAPARKHIIKKLVTCHNSSLTDEDLDVICQNTEGYSGADMANLCKEASLGPIRSLDFSTIEYISPDQVRPIVLKDFLEALKQVRASVSDQDLNIYLEWNKRYGSSST